MQSKKNMLKNMLAVATLLLPSAYFCSCATAKKTDERTDESASVNRMDKFIPTHPPVVVPHSWRENIRE